MRGRVVIVGASHAGLAAADALRRAGYAGAVTLVSRERCLPYQRPLLSKAADLLELPAERLAIRKPEFFAENDVELVLGREVVEIAPEAKTVVFSDGGKSGYDHLVLATGARARTLPDAIVSGRAPLNLRTLDEAVDFRRRFRPGGRLVVVGGGLIGLEVAALARHAGMDVTVLEAAGQVMGRVVPPTIAQYVQAFHERSGITVRLGVTITHIRGGDAGYSVTLGSGEVLSADIVLSAIGTVPEVEVAKRANLDIENGIRVTERGQTSMAGIWAIGDCAAWQINPESRHRIRFEGIQPATEQAKIVAQAITGQESGPLPLPRFWSHQGALRLQMAGTWSGETEMVRHGNPHEEAFCELAMVDGRPVACFAVNAASEFRNAVRLIESGTTVSSDRDVADALAP